MTCSGASLDSNLNSANWRTSCNGFYLLQNHSINCMENSFYVSYWCKIWAKQGKGFNAHAPDWARWLAQARPWTQTWTLPPDQRVVKVYLLWNPWIKCVEFEFWLGLLKMPKLRSAVSRYQPSSTRLQKTTYNLKPKSFGNKWWSATLLLHKLYSSNFHFVTGWSTNKICTAEWSEKDKPSASSAKTDTLALLPSVKRQVFCVGDRVKMDKHKAWATTIVAPK